jgi:hypothetical protein
VGWAAESHAPGSGFLTPAHHSARRSKHWQPSPVRSLRKRLHCTPTPSPPHLSIPASSTRSRFRLIVIPSQNGSVRSLQQARPPSLVLAVGGQDIIERSGSSNVAACLTPIPRRPVTPGLSSLPFSSTQCLSSHSASMPRWSLKNINLLSYPGYSVW